MSQESHSKSRVEFLTDRADYFIDKRELYLAIKDDISSAVEIPLSLIRICGSAYWGRSFTNDRPFSPSESDLDVALISSSLFIKCLSEVRQITRNFTNLISFRGNINSSTLFQDYAIKKGIIRVDLMPQTKTKISLDKYSDRVSKKYEQHFSKVSFAIYDTESSFTVKQINATAKFKGERQ